MLSNFVRVSLSSSSKISLYKTIVQEKSFDCLRPRSLSLVHHKFWLIMGSYGFESYRKLLFPQRLNSQLIPDTWVSRCACLRRKLLVIKKSAVSSKRFYIHRIYEPASSSYRKKINFAQFGVFFKNIRL